MHALSFHTTLNLLTEDEKIEFALKTQKDKTYICN